MAVLVIAEHNHAALNPAVYSLVTAAQKIGGDIDIMIAAQEGGKLAEEAAKINGIRRVLLSEAPYFAEELPENLAASVLEVAKEYATRGTEFLKKTSAEIFRFYLKDPYASQFRKMLSIEKYRSPELDHIYQEIYMESALSYQAALFEEMMAQGLMRQADASIMALQFFAPIFLLLNQYDGIPEKAAAALEILGRHIEQFDQIYRKGVEQ